MIIGCVGLSGSGKSEACLILEYLNIYNINVDKIYNNILLYQFEKLKNSLTKCFNENVFFNKNIFLKTKIINIIFTNKYYLKCFNSIIKKHLILPILKEIFLAKKNKKICVIDAPLLFEYNLDKLCDFILLIKSKESIRLKRIYLREPKIKLNYLKRRMNFQKNEIFYSKKYKNFYYIKNMSTNFELFLNLNFFLENILCK